MATGQLSGVIHHLRSAMLRDGGGLTDGRLLEDYVCRRDQAALAALVRRHGPMVWGVCRRVLGNYHDAEDAFQATFLVLVRRAASIAAPELVANWLYGVGLQTARKARAMALKRKARERQAAEMLEPAAVEPDVWDDVRPLLDEELSRLPEIHRAVVVLCDLEGKSRKEAARHLGLAEGTVGSRLARARVMLAKRLARRGVVLSGGALAAVLAENAASAGAPAAVVSGAIHAASSLAAGQAAGVVSAKVAALTEGVLKAMTTSKIKAAFVVMFVIGVLGLGGGVVVRQAQATAHEAIPLVEIPEEQPDLSGTWRGDDWGTVVLRSAKKGAFEGTYSDTFGKDVGRIAVQWSAASRRYEGTWSEGTLRFGRIALEAGKGGDVITGAYTTDPKCEHEPGVPSLASLRWSRVGPAAGRSDKPADELTAWGKEAGGLQAGLGFYPGEKRAYRHGEKARLAVRVRNVGKEDVKFEYLRQFFIETPPAVTDGAGKAVPLPRILAEGFHVPVEVTLAPGKEIELYELKLEAPPASERGKGGRATLYGTGKFQVQYERVLGNTSSGIIAIDAALSRLGTGRVAVEVKAEAGEKK